MRIELESIESVTLSERGSGPILVVAALWLLPLVAIILILEPWAGGGMNWSNLGLRNTVLPLFLTFVAANETLGRRDRSELVVRAGGREHRFVTPSDTYSAEKMLDRKVLRDVLDACRSQGVPGCLDQTSRSGVGL